MYLHGVNTLENKNIKKIPDKLSMLFLRENEPEVTVALTHSDLDDFEKDGNRYQKLRTVFSKRHFYRFS